MPNRLPRVGDVVEGRTTGLRKTVVKVGASIHGDTLFAVEDIICNFTWDLGNWRIIEPPEDVGAGEMGL